MEHLIRIWMDSCADPHVSVSTRCLSSSIMYLQYIGKWVWAVPQNAERERATLSKALITLWDWLCPYRRHFGMQIHTSEFLKISNERVAPPDFSSALCRAEWEQLHRDEALQVTRGGHRGWHKPINCEIKSEGFVLSGWSAPFSPVSPRKEISYVVDSLV